MLENTTPVLSLSIFICIKFLDGLHADAFYLAFQSPTTICHTHALFNKATLEIGVSC